ncbi:hypothetical protein AB0H82_02140 [Streptomyces sp. NPDC050732]|uniref:hypothetical protein n=1 Tax=Streptomyces sp. NPDC050732 TaxID=3154632 RepID=UPI0034163CEA
MSDRAHDEKATPKAAPAPDPHAALRAGHVARAKSAAVRAAAVCHHIERHGAEQNTAWQATHAARASVQALAVLSESAPDPAADSRCARNAAAAAARAAQLGQLHDGDSEPAVAACRAALQASRAASAAAGRDALGADEALNAAADRAEAAARTAAEHAGWLRPGRRLPEIPTGLRSPELMAMLHF